MSMRNRRYRRTHLMHHQKRYGHPRIEVLSPDGGMIGGGELARGLIGKIQESFSNDVVYLCKTSCTRGLFAVHYEGSIYIVAYSNKQKRVIHIFPPETVDDYRYKLPDSWFEKRQEKA